MMIQFRTMGALCLLLLTVAADALLATAFSTPAAAQQAGHKTRFNIPASDLASALKIYIAQSGERILFSDAARRGRQSPAVRGVLRTDMALRRLLDGNDIVIRPGSGGVLVLQPREKPVRVVRLATTQVTAPTRMDGTPAAAVRDPAPAPSEEIIVTAQRVAQNLQKVPVSVAVVSGNALAERNIRTLEDLSAQQPAIRVAQAPASDQLHVRGVGSGFNAGFEQSVATFVDGVYRSRSRSSRIALFDIDRVEILKGPQTIFFGANAIAGALNITTRKAGDNVAANVSALYSPSDGEYNLEAGVSMPIADGLAVRVAGRASGMNGFIRNVAQATDGPRLRDVQGRISLHYSGGALTIDARYDKGRLRDEGTFNAELVGCPPAGRPAVALCARALALSGGTIDDDLNYRSNQGTPTFSNLDMDEVALTARLDLDFATLVSTTAHTDQLSDQLVDLGPFPVPGPLGTRSYVPYRSRDDFRQFSQELRLDSKQDGPVDYVVGAYYEKGKLLTPAYSGFYFNNFAAIFAGAVPANARLAARTILQQRSETFSAFGSVTYHLTDRLSASGSLRYSRVVKNAARSALFGTGDEFLSVAGFVPLNTAVQNPISAVLGVSNAPFADGRRVDDAFMPSVRGTFDISDDVMVYAAYTRGFKAGGYSASSADMFDPEFVNNYEAGLKARWFDRRLVTNIAVYQADYSNLQEAQNVTGPTGALLSLIRNVAKSRSRGAELSSTLRASDALRLRADVSYLDAKYMSYPSAPCAPYEAAPGVACTRDATGQRRAFAPTWSGSVGADFDKSLSSDVNLGLGVTLAFTSHFYQQSIITDYVDQPGYTKVDARISLSAPNKRWEVALIGRNLTDKMTAGYRVHAPAAGAAIIALPDRPRSLAIQLSGKW